MPKYEINVRAVVRASHPDADADYDVADWDVYDSVNLRTNKGTSVVVRCD